MIVSPPSDALDVELLDLADSALRESGYVVQRFAIGGLDYVLAEDVDNVVALTAVVSVDAVLRTEPVVSNVLATRFANLASSPKRWDGYVVLLTSEVPDDSLAEPLFALTYNLARVRRVVRVGVEPTRAGVHRALRPILPLTKVADHIAPGDALRALEERLVADGVPPHDVSLALGEFRAQHGALTEFDDAPSAGDDDVLVDPSTPVP